MNKWKLAFGVLFFWNVICGVFSAYVGNLGLSALNLVVAGLAIIMYRANYTHGLQ